MFPPCEKCGKRAYPLSGETIRKFRLLKGLKVLSETSGDTFLESLKELDGMQLCSDCYDEVREVERSVVTIMTQERLLRLQAKMRENKGDPK